jgi:hypothetical protein
MEKKVFVINIIIIVCIITIIAILVAIYIYSGEKPSEECVDPSAYMNLRYDVCYGAYSKNLLINVIRGRDIYDIQNITMSFKDSIEETTTIKNIPVPGETKSYKIYSSKNPGEVTFSLNVSIEENLNFCKDKTIFVRSCGISEELNLTGNISQVGTSSNITSNFTVTKPTPSADLLSPDLVNKNGIWEPICKSEWICSDWEECTEGIQKRDCNDKNSCFISTSIPDFARPCDNICRESWQCEWSSCIDGNSVPTCIDKNSCGTEYSKPKEVDCGIKKCTPDLQCGNWSNCKTNYEFNDLNSGIQNLEGIKSRLCEDKNNCVNSQYETQNCSMKLNIYSKSVVWCGKKYIEIYDKTTNKMLSRIKNDKQGNLPLIEISLDIDSSKIGDSTQDYCDYCFNGIKDNDEQGVDCGGSCKECAAQEYKKDYLSSISNWLKNLLGL